MKTVSDNIREIVKNAQSKLKEITPENACCRADADSWSKQEILGHLIDSALNNAQRVVRGAQNAAELFPPYDQKHWVAVQGYNQRNWMDIIDFWEQCNLHLCSAIDRLPEEALNNPCNFGKETPVPLRVVIEDYPRHLKMHLGDILGITL